MFSTPEASETGLKFVNKLSPTEDLNILDYLYFYNGGGVAVGDINNDGLPDIYFSGNMVKNKLYLNKGNLRFEDITEKAGVAGNSDWNTGVTMADINGDGFLDIYVCAVVGIHGFRGHNELFINNGNGTFEEKSEEYGLDIDNFSSSASFFDYDLDGDLDVYLLNHAVHTETSFGNANIRNKRDYESGDKLLRNNGGRFIDVSEAAGIFGGVNGYGLGLSVADFNQDGYPDIYVGNDFHEDDYFYLNNRDGTFKESIKAFFGHTSKFSMGNDASDINHDGYPDLISLDMLPEDEEVLKSSAGDDDYSRMRIRTQNLGYHYQYARNMLQINRNGQFFSEQGLMSNIASTDWSWSPLFADFDQDGEQDLFVTNGISKRPNDLDYIKFISNEEIQRHLNETKIMDNQALEKMPSGVISNYFFKGSSSLKFKDMSGRWDGKTPIISNGSAFADFDNDGDLDLITNNLNQPPTLYQNLTDNSKNHFLRLNLKYGQQNPFAVGAEVYAYCQGQLQYKQLIPSRGFQSSSQYTIHFGLGPSKMVDSLQVVWPDRKVQRLYHVKANQHLEVSYEQGNKNTFAKFHPDKRILFERVDSLGLEYIHEENSYIDFNRSKLIPYKISDRGPAFAIDDFNGDGLEDVFFGNGKHVKNKLFLQKNTGVFEASYQKVFEVDSLLETETALFLDVNADGKQDLFVASGGGEFFGESNALLDQLYLNSESGLTKMTIPEPYANSSIARPYDFDQDGDLDIFIGVSAISNNFGALPSSYILENDKGILKHKKIDAFDKIGMVTDALWTDFDKDGLKDLIVVGEWIQPQFFRNKNGDFTNVTPRYLPEKLNGLWRAITPFDIDHDGDMDYLLGNWGMNSKFTASKEFPLLLYHGDIDQNGTSESIVAIEKKGRYYTTKGYDELSEQLPNPIRKKYTSYRDFAGQDIEEIFGGLLQKANVLQVHTLASGFLRNDQGNFIFEPFHDALQVAPINCFLSFDFDSDNKNEVLCAGNFFGVTPYHGRFDGFSSALIKDETTIIHGNELGLELQHKVTRGLGLLHIKDEPHLLVSLHNDGAHLYKIKQ